MYEPIEFKGIDTASLEDFIDSMDECSRFLYSHRDALKAIFDNPSSNLSEAQQEFFKDIDLLKLRASGYHGKPATRLSKSQGRNCRLGILKLRIGNPQQIWRRVDILLPGFYRLLSINLGSTIGHDRCNKLTAASLRPCYRVNKMMNRIAIPYTAVHWRKTLA